MDFLVKNIFYYSSLGIHCHGLEEPHPACNIFNPLPLPHWRTREQVPSSSPAEADPTRKGNPRLLGGSKQWS